MVRVLPDKATCHIRAASVDHRREKHAWGQQAPAISAADRNVDDPGVAFLAVKLVASVRQIAHHCRQHPRLVALAAVGGTGRGGGAAQPVEGERAGSRDWPANARQPDCAADCSAMQLNAIWQFMHSPAPATHLCRPTPVMTCSSTPPGWPSPPRVTRYLRSQKRHIGRWAGGHGMRQ